MKNMLFVLILAIPFLTLADVKNNISGQVSIAKGLESQLKPAGVLFIFAKKASQAEAKGVPPLAVLRIPSPHFPMSFTLSEENSMMAGTPFVGPFVVYARYSPSGDALDKSGPQGLSHSKKPLQLGAKNIVVELKNK